VEPLGGSDAANHPLADRHIDKLLAVGGTSLDERWAVHAVTVQREWIAWEIRKAPFYPYHFAGLAALSDGVVNRRGEQPGSSFGLGGSDRAIAEDQRRRES
jgi:hypothetical protein